MWDLRKLTQFLGNEMSPGFVSRPHGLVSEVLRLAIITAKDRVVAVTAGY